MRLLALTLGFAATFAAAWVLPAQESRPGAEAVDLRNLEVSGQPARATFALHEPIVTEFKFENLSTRRISFGLARYPFGTLYFMTLTITRPDGTRLVRELSEEMDYISGPGGVSLAAGERAFIPQVLNEWYDFNEVGEYHITATIPISADEQTTSRSDPRATVKFSFRVGPPNPDQIKETCARLAGKANSRNGNEKFEAIHALRFAKDPLCVPALASTLTHLNGMIRDEALRGLAAVGSAEAAAAVAGAWTHLDRDEKDLALQMFASEGAGEALRAALVAHGDLPR